MKLKKELKTYEEWNQAFDYYGAKGSPRCKIDTESFDLELFLVEGLNYCKEGVRTFSAFYFFWEIVIDKIDKNRFEDYLKKLDYDKALLGYFLEKIPSDKTFEFLHFAKPHEKPIVLFSNPLEKEIDPIFLKYNIVSTSIIPQTEDFPKYLQVDILEKHGFIKIEYPKPYNPSRFDRYVLNFLEKWFKF